jgi:trans-2-enoyl-CoA reductase
MASNGQKVVLITGCSSGIGLRMAVMLANDEQKRYHGTLFPSYFNTSFDISLSSKI